MTNDKGIFIKNIYWMLSYAFQILKQDDYASVAAEQFEKMHDLLAAILAKGVSRQIKQGLYREYVPTKNNLTLIRGKINTSETMNCFMQKKQQLVCEFDEFTEDNLYNQILKTTIQRLINIEDVDEERKQALRKLMVFFGNVSIIPIDHIEWNRLIYQRNNRNYELLLNICYLVINNMIQTTEEGGYKLHSFTDEHMERLYERFILEYYKYHHPELDPKAAQVKWNLTQIPDQTMIRFLPTMQTDITLQNDSKTLIIDAKYYGKSMIQNYDKASLRSAHLYQIFAYVKNMDINNTGNISGLLLYAKTHDEVFPNGDPFIIGGNSIGAKTLDLNRDFADISQQLEDLVKTYFG